MSRYFQTLKKLQQQRVDETTESLSSAVEPALPATPAPAPRWGPETPEEIFPELPLAHREAAWSQLLESLRAQSQSGQPILVVAGVSDVESSRRLVIGLGKQAGRRGVFVQHARLTHTQEGRMLSLVDGGEGDYGSPLRPDDSSSKSSAVRGFDLSGSQTDRALVEWLGAARKGADLLVIEAPGVLSSADTTLLAKSCDGLALIVEPLITDRTALKAAVDRAQASGCTIIGLIINGHRDWLPRWLIRLLPD